MDKNAFLYIMSLVQIYMGSLAVYVEHLIFSLINEKKNRQAVNSFEDVIF